MGGSIQGELENRLRVLLLHLLRWEHESARHDSSWRATMRVQRRDLGRHLVKNPSLKSKLDDAARYAYGTAVVPAAGEAGLPEQTFRETCPWTFDEIMDEAFWPGRSS